MADTHAVVWYIYDDRRLSARARATIEDAAAAGDQVGLSCISLAEMLYLQEKGRIHPEVLGRVLSALEDPGTVLVDLPF